MLILAYHRVFSDTPDTLAVSLSQFRQQMEYLKKSGWHMQSVRESIEVLKGRESSAPCMAVLTFDDGFEDVYSYAFPILREHGFSATVFLISDFLGSRTMPVSMAQISDRRFLSWDQIGAMQAQGIDFGSHSKTHPNLTKLDPAALHEEVAGSKAELERHLGGPVSSFCYPAGQLNQHVIDEVKRTGYEVAFVTPRSTGIPRTVHTLKRVSIYRHDTHARFKFKVSRYFPVLRELKLALYGLGAPAG